MPENCRFDACIVISKDYQMEDSIYEGELSGGKYLIYENTFFKNVFSIGCILVFAFLF